VRRLGKPFAHPLVVLIALPNNLDRTRVAVSASRSLGNAVARNRAKRRIRAVIQCLCVKIKSGSDLVIIARKPLHQASYQDLYHAISSKLVEANLLNNNDDD
jgi:ribonuclease P protein component